MLGTISPWLIEKLAFFHIAFSTCPNGWLLQIMTWLSLYLKTNFSQKIETC